MEISQAWDEVAEGYDRYFVPRFAPWVKAAVEAVQEPLPPGPILVPCCGTFPELPDLIRAFPTRKIIGIDLSPGMVRLARERATPWPQAQVIEGDAATLTPGTAAAVVSVFGLQQLPDPQAALTSWAKALLPGGQLSVVYWPSQVETEGPFALLAELRGEPPSLRDQDLREPLTQAGMTATLQTLAFPMTHPSPQVFWEAMTTAGPLKALALRQGPAHMQSLQTAFLTKAPQGPWHHTPQAHHLKAHT
ncbi:class I SAM-dependent methyltransferase [Spirillospora sp. CA-294931]|uniref:class I SAM-dependent methyltransferase n=1 Tax=Spirillospora sp. CA-294931 TaxID=3240042 RepID=UPI003D8EBB3D